MSQLPERIGKTINQLDIDFSRFNFAGWCVSLASLSVGLLAALAAYWAVLDKIPNDKGPALVFGLTMIGTTVALFIALRAILAKFAVPIVKDRPEDTPTGL